MTRSDSIVANGSSPNNPLAKRGEPLHTANGAHAKQHVVGLSRTCWEGGSQVGGGGGAAQAQEVAYQEGRGRGAGGRPPARQQRRPQVHWELEQDQERDGFLCERGGAEGVEGLMRTRWGVVVLVYGVSKNGLVRMWRAAELMGWGLRGMLGTAAES